MKLELRRNDPCSCGSGKKYKKCCMKKENVIQLHAVKEERFYQQKHALVVKVKDFVSKKLPLSKQYQLHTEFKRRTDHTLNEQAEKQFFDFWLIFFNRFDNGLRGIELFVQENGSRLSEDEHEMANTWSSLKPRLIQAIDSGEKSVLFEDAFTHEQFPVARMQENLPSVAPWYGTIALLEPFDTLFYFNGVRKFESPQNFHYAVKKVDELREEKELNHEQILMDYFPEILAAIAKGEERELGTKEIHQYNSYYTIEDSEAVDSFFQNEGIFVMDKWEPAQKLCNWVKNWHQYSDSEISGPIRMGSVYGSIRIEGNQLTFVTLDEARAEEFKGMMERVGAVSFVNEETHTQTVPFQVEIINTISSMNEDTPQYFAFYAKHDLRFDLDKSLPLFDGSSISELIAAGRKDEVKAYLQQREYSLYVQAHYEFKDIAVTPDFNSVRRELGLPLSPFVTGGKSRASSIEKIDSPLAKKKSIVKEEDIPNYELLGFTPATVDNFFAGDFVTFFKEKTEGKSDLTLRKYRNCLFDLREIFLEHPVSSWEECDETFWHNVFLADFPNLYKPLSKTVVKDFASTTKALAKWIEKEKGVKGLSKVVNQIAKDAEEPLLELV